MDLAFLGNPRAKLTTMLPVRVFDIAALTGRSLVALLGDGVVREDGSVIRTSRIPRRNRSSSVPLGAYLAPTSAYQRLYS